MQTGYIRQKLFDYARNDMENIGIADEEIWEEIDKMDTGKQLTVYWDYEDKNTPPYEKKALLRAEQIGVYSYKVKGNKMVYISYFGSEGFYKVTHNLDTGEETRKHQATTKQEYNYYCG